MAFVSGVSVLILVTIGLLFVLLDTQKQRRSIRREGAMKKFRKLIIDIKLWWFKYNERCSYCGWYLHPQFRYKTKRPMGMVPCMDKDGLMICSNCANNPNSNY